MGIFTLEVIVGESMVDLTEHEKKIFDLIKQNPDVISSRQIREEVAQNNGMSEKTLRNRIGDLRRYGLLSQSESQSNESSIVVKNTAVNELNQSTYLMVWAIASLASLAIFIIYF
tara:strand:- start:9651 stop:9995 length:345 start_codon:yes stop_codon:yes gene_type:complete